MPDKTTQIAIRFGAVSPPLAEQLDEQGILYDKQACERWQKWQNSIALLYVSGLLTDGEKTKAHQRLFKRIGKELTEYAAKRKESPKMKPLVEAAAS